MITKVTISDFNNIKKSFTEEEIKEKYGYLEIMSQQEFKKRKMKQRKRIN